MLVLLGIDWAASDESKCGLARAEVEGTGRVVVVELLTGKDAPGGTSAALLATWLAAHPHAMIGIDAPLGWPARLADAIATHTAGEPLGVRADASAYFTRETDRVMQRELRKSPLEVGADRIARTAFSALALIHELRAKTGLALPMVMGPGDRGLAEVYPAATLKVLFAGERVPSYKKPEQRDAREAILERLRHHVVLKPRQRALCIESDHVLDAVVCTLAAADIARGRAVGPTLEQSLAARREGWIWARRPENEGPR